MKYLIFFDLISNKSLKDQVIFKKKKVNLTTYKEVTKVDAFLVHVMVKRPVPERVNCLIFLTHILVWNKMYLKTMPLAIP